MTRKSGPGAHLDVRLVLDYLDRKLDTRGRERFEEHLARPCPTCRERVRAVGELMDTMLSDRSAPVPEAMRERALAAFAPSGVPKRSRPLLEVLGELMFDSFVSPLPASTRRAVGEARRMRFRLGGHALDLEIEREGATVVSLRGRLQAPEPALWTLAVQSGSERRSVRPDATGSFAIENVPAGPLEVRLNAAAGRFRLPVIEP